MWLKTDLKVLVLLFCLVGLVKGTLTLLSTHDGRRKYTGSCNSFGHSCWGAHGKRSNIQTRRTNNEWKILKLMPENSEQVKTDVTSQLFSEDVEPIFGEIKNVDAKTLDMPGISTSEENQNNLSHRYPKKKYRISKYKFPIDTGSNEDLSADISNINLAIRDEYKMPNYRFLKMLRKDLIN